jgi:hypothetical protein
MFFTHLSGVLVFNILLEVYIFKGRQGEEHTHRFALRYPEIYLKSSGIVFPLSRPSLRLGLSTRSARARLRACCSPFGLAVCPAHDQRMRIKRIENGENSPSGGDTAFRGSIHFFVVFAVVYSISSGSIYPSANFLSLAHMSFCDLLSGSGKGKSFGAGICSRCLKSFEFLQSIRLALNGGSLR